MHVAVDHPEAIPLAEIFDFDDGGHEVSGLRPRVEHGACPPARRAYGSERS
jgi:hypothetical protein